MDECLEVLNNVLEVEKAESCLFVKPFLVLALLDELYIFDDFFKMFGAPFI